MAWWFFSSHRWRINPFIISRRHHHFYYSNFRFIKIYEFIICKSFTTIFISFWNLNSNVSQINQLPNCLLSNSHRSHRSRNFKINKFGIDVSSFNLDHFGYQSSSDADYDLLLPEFEKIATLLST